MNIKRIAMALVASSVLAACSNEPTITNKEVSQIDSNEVAQLNQWFDDVFERNLMDYPQFLTRLGRKDRQSELNDISEEHSLKNLEEAKKDLADLLKFDPSKLDEQSNLSFR